VLLRELTQLNYRNLLTPKLAFGEGINAVVGPNASGKSNVLEAVYLACSGELPGGRVAEAVRLGEQDGYVSVKLEHQSGTSLIQVGLTPGRKAIRLDGQLIRSFELVKVAAAVLITPEDAGLVHGSPSQRRHYLDALLSKLSLRYALMLREYIRVLEQRNAALKSPHADATLAVWSEKFVDLGQGLQHLRERAVKRIAELAAAAYNEIAADGKVLGVALQSGEGYDLQSALEASRAEERARGATVVGPHRDDLLLGLDGHSLQAYGSRGEARTAALALRVAEYQLLLEKHGEAPVLLIDDFTAELDQSRRRYLLELAAATPQTLVSGTEAPPEFKRCYRIDAGRLTPA
jgi:DNA replication and repair protein RecF